MTGMRKSMEGRIVSDFTEDDVIHFMAEANTYGTLAREAVERGMAAVAPAMRDRFRAEALREAADEVRSLAVNGENDGLTWTPGNAGTEAYNEGIKEAWQVIRARADAEEGK